MDQATKDDALKLYADWAPWWHLLSPPNDYADEAASYGRLLTTNASISVRTLLEMGSGGGNNAFHLKKALELTLVDCAKSMLDTSASLNPECEHIEGDMRTLRLGRTFDAVLIHDAIAYMRTESDLRAAVETAFVHCRPGGAALFAPDFVHETFKPSTDHGGIDDGCRGARYLEWMWDPNPADTMVLAHFALLLRHEQNVDCVHEVHELGLFPKATWMNVIADAGFQPRCVPFPHEVRPDVGAFVFIGTRAPYQGEQLLS